MPGVTTRIRNILYWLCSAQGLCRLQVCTEFAHMDFRFYHTGLDAADSSSPPTCSCSSTQTFTARHPAAPPPSRARHRRPDPPHHALAVCRRSLPRHAHSAPRPPSPHHVTAACRRPPPPCPLRPTNHPPARPPTAACPLRIRPPASHPLSPSQPYRAPQSANAGHGP